MAVGTATASTASTPSSAATSSRQARKASVVTAGLVSTGPVTTAPGGSSLRSVRRVAAPSCTTCRPWSAHASAASAPAPPVLETIATRLPAGSGWQASSAAVSMSSPRLVVAMIPACVEQGLLGGQRRRGCRGVRGRAVARRGPAADDGQHRHPLRDPAGRAGELARVAERLHVQDPQLGHLILRPPGQQVSRGHVVLVADRGEGGYADAEPGQLPEQRDPHPAGLHDERRRRPERVVGGEGRVQADPGHDDAEAVRPDQPHAVPAADGQQVRARGAQAGSYHDEGPDPVAAALRRHFGHGGRRHRDHRQVHLPGQVIDRSHAGHSLHGPGMRIHRVDRPGEAARHDVAQDGPADGAAARLGPTTATDRGCSSGRRLATSARLSLLATVSR